MAPFLTDASVTLFLASSMGAAPHDAGSPRFLRAQEWRRGTGPCPPTTSALPFVPYDDGIAPERSHSYDERLKPPRASRGIVGALAFRRSGATGDFEHAKLIRKFGRCRTT
jgi:hypothetical protein